MEEIWKKIKLESFDIYVSNKGNVKKGGKILSLNSQNSYLKLTDKKANNGKGKTYSLHRLIAIAFIPNPKKKPHINHKNGIKTDNNIENLEWCTARENLQHAYKTGLKVGVRGEKSHFSKLSDSQVQDIISESEYMLPKHLAEIYGVTKNHINYILRKNT